MQEPLVEAGRPFQEVAHVRPVGREPPGLPLKTRNPAQAPGPSPPHEPAAHEGPVLPAQARRATVRHASVTCETRGRAQVQS